MSPRRLVKLLTIYKLLLRSRQYFAAVTIVAVTCSIFLAASSVSLQLTQQIQTDLPQVLSGNAYVRSIEFRLYVSDGGCLASVNSTSFFILTGMNSGSVVGEKYQSLNLSQPLKVYPLPGFMNYCILSTYTGQQSLHELGEGRVVIGGSDPASFVTSAVLSFASSLSMLQLLGYISAFTVSFSAWLFVTSSLKKGFDVLYSQGYAKNQLLLGLIVSSLISSLVLFIMLIFFSLFLQSLAIGIVNFTIGGSFLYSSISYSSVMMGVSYSLLFLIASILISVLHKPRVMKIGGRAMLLSIVCVVAISSSIPFVEMISSSSDLNYTSSAHGYSVIPASSPFPLTSSLRLQNISCSNYSAEIAFPAQINGFRSIGRGLVPANSSSFVGYRLINGSWPEKIYEVALGQGISSMLGVRDGDVVKMIDQLSGNAASFLVTGIYTAPGEYGYEAITTVQGASALASLPPGYYSYVRVSPSCIGDFFQSGEVRGSQLSIPQIFSRIIAHASTLSQAGYALYPDVSPVVNSLASIALILILGSTAGLWFSSTVYFESIREEMRIRWEQGQCKGSIFLRHLLPLVALIFLLTAISVLAGSYISSYFASSIFHQKLVINFTVYQNLLILAIFTSSFFSLLRGIWRMET